MSLFPAFPSSEFGTLFRLLDDYDAHRSERTRAPIRAFQPKFDLKETNDKYELHGELPGLEQKDVNIEFTDPQTLVVSGHTEREYTSGTPPAGVLEAGKQPAKIEGSKKATVEDEVSPNAGNKEVQTKKKQPQEQEESKYWISERSIGEFYRTFQFPSNVDHEKVKASLKNGILSVVVPKAAAPTARKITIE
ncbi:MAG: hypothetical protein M1834_003645 [Cirrosporium novae-zelandiae]|nr:MAG: hypothetical protein M1834_003645 [Cirrosporium novae-zelandiae]